jgi:hypothetical protein
MNYREKIIHGALDLVVTSGTTDSETEGGIVDFPVAVDALLATIATLASQSGNYPNPRAARLFAESCGKGISQMMKQLEAREINWLMEPIGRPN